MFEGMSFGDLLNFNPNVAQMLAPDINGLGPQGSSAMMNPLSITGGALPSSGFSGPSPADGSVWPPLPQTAAQIPPAAQPTSGPMATTPSVPSDAMYPGGRPVAQMPSDAPKPQPGVGDRLAATLKGVNAPTPPQAQKVSTPSAPQTRAPAASLLPQILALLSSGGGQPAPSLGALLGGGRG